ncbi:MAG: M3 family metallopeptidase [Tannerella sp.]|nr:M3 family metallopeptidase [Tannerella sp.]
MKIIILNISLLALLSACNSKNDAMDTNPLMQPSALPYGAPDFTKIKLEHFKPAIEAGIEEKLAEIAKIADNSEPATFDNTLAALERSGQLLNRAYGVFMLLTGANTNPDLQALEEEMSPKMAALSNALYLNDKMFARVKTVYQNRASLDAESKRLAEVTYEHFVLQGANIKADQKDAFKALSEEEATLCTRFANKLLAAAKDAALIVDDVKMLEGLSAEEIQNLALNANDANDANDANLRDGTFLIPVKNTTQQDILQSLTNREMRKKLFESAWSRAEKGDDNDTRAIITRIAEIRAKQAKILGFKNFAEWNLKDQMAKTPEAALAFMSKLAPGAIEKAKRESARIQEVINKSGENFQLEAYDWNIWQEQVRKADFDLADSLLKPYFMLDNVMEKGIFHAATRLYGITFKERNDIPVYQDDVRVFELFEDNGNAIGLFYVDYYKRDNKSGGAWMGNIIEQSHLLGHKPVIYNVCNFTKPAEGQPALISFDDVETLFHEFGHALHGFFANQKYPSLSGTNVSRDFVELPSQINEHWSLHPEVFNNYAVHWQTGEKMPAELYNKLLKTATFNQGYMLTELLEAALLDMEWHAIEDGTAITDALEFERQALERTGLNLKEIPPRYRSTYFLHIWGHGYAAGYYAYLWAEMLDNDAYSWFEENGGLTRANGQRFRDMILSQGNSQDLEKIFVAFRGRKPEIAPLLKHRGL